MNKKEFLEAVVHEVETLKRIAKKNEINMLDFDRLDPNDKSLCIYGQMTNDCGSGRAKELMDKACIIVTNIPSDIGDGGTDVFYESTFNEIKSFINGKNEG